MASVFVQKEMFLGRLFCAFERMAHLRHIAAAQSQESGAFALTDSQSLLSLSAATPSGSSAWSLCLHYGNSRRRALRFRRRTSGADAQTRTISNTALRA